MPHRPGVYIYRDVNKKVIYVGKAKDLHNRVRSYFQSPEKLTPKTQSLVEHINDIDFFIASSEQEALIMELNFIKQYRPHYNIMLKDDKSFPYLKIDLTKNGRGYMSPAASSRTADATSGRFPIRGRSSRPSVFLSVFSPYAFAVKT